MDSACYWERIKNDAVEGDGVTDCARKGIVTSQPDKNVRIGLRTERLLQPSKEVYIRWRLTRTDDFASTHSDDCPMDVRCKRRNLHYCVTVEVVPPMPRE